MPPGPTFYQKPTTRLIRVLLEWEGGYAIQFDQRDLERMEAATTALEDLNRAIALAKRLAALNGG